MVILAFQTDLARFLELGFRLVFHDVLIGVDFRLDETFFKISMDDAGTLRRSITGLESPTTALIFTYRKESLQT